MIWYWYGICHGNEISDLAYMESIVEFTLSAGFGKKLAIASQVIGDGMWSCVHSLLQSDGESTDLKRLLILLFSWLMFLQMQVPKLVGDEVRVFQR